MKVLHALPDGSAVVLLTDYEMRARNRGPAFTATSAGRDIPFFAFPETGEFLGVDHAAISNRPVLLSVAMNTDGTPTKDDRGDYDIVEVVNIEGLDLDGLNWFFMSAFEPHQFAGR